MNAPVATERKSFLPLRLQSKTIIESNSVPTDHRHITAVTSSMPLAVQNDTKPSFKVADRVLINGLKQGTIRYVGTVEFAQGLFCGIELDDADGKHDGQVNNIRYFQCETNHGIFVPHDKVVLMPQGRTNSTTRIISRLKAPTMTRSLTLPLSLNKRIKTTAIKSSIKSTHLPDIIPNTSTSIQAMSITETINEPIMSDHHEMNRSQTETNTILESPSLPTDEPLETDFSDSVSLILHQLQNEQNVFFSQPSISTMNSEDGTMDDDDIDDDDDRTDGTDELENESIAESTMSEQVQPTLLLSSTISIQTDLSFDVKDNITFLKNNLSNSKLLSTSTKSLAGSIQLINKPKVNTQEIKVNNNIKKPTMLASCPIANKEIERKLPFPLTNSLNSPRKSSIVPPKKSSSRMNELNSMNWRGSQSKVNKSISSSNSLNSSHSDLSSNQPTTSKMTSKSTSRTIRPMSHSIDLSLDKKQNQTRRSLDISDNQWNTQNILFQSLEVAHECLKKNYQNLLRHFHTMLILSQYYMKEYEQMKQQHTIKLSKIRIVHLQLKNFIEQLKSSHKNEFSILNEQYQTQIETMKVNYNEKSLEYQQEIDKLQNEKITLETHSTSLQEQIDRFMQEIANSEHDDPLLRRVETLEKDRTSLQTVLEMRNQELTQLRTRINEQVFQREDQIALQRRIDMAENRNQDLVCLLRTWQLNEKAALVERDELKEQVAQLERDNQQLTFENETLLYRLRQKSMSVSFNSPATLNLSNRSTQKVRNRAQSFSSIFASVNNQLNRHLTRSLSLN